MNISNRKPEIYDKCHQVFGVEWERGIVITYGDTVYVNSRFTLSEDLKIHECVHIEQQRIMGKDIWWEKYFSDNDFRCSQEVEAYRAQIKYVKENYPRNIRRALERKVYKDMSTFYGDMCTSEEEAKNLLK